MARIAQLPTDVVNKIAAGEVIERPGSVVKELLENSVDALATRIEVDVADGGLEQIRVVDNGEGIHPQDLLLAVASHATSKIQQADDLFQVQTLGFRGEALASIAAVSRFCLKSRTAEASEGTLLEVEAGTMSPPLPCGCPVGTAVEVRQLFLNTPVRRKFLKSQATELGHVSEQFTRVALGHPRLHMVLRHNEKRVYELPASERLLDRISLFFGAELAEQLIWVESEAGPTRLWGYVGNPSQSKSSRKGQYLFLNGRWIQDRSLQHALGEAYRGLLMVGRNPISFLFIEMPPDQVDVNVHPTKAEVRFRESSALYRQLLTTLRSRFLSTNLDGTLRVPKSPAAPVSPADQQQAAGELVAWAREQALHWGAPAPREAGDLVSPALGILPAGRQEDHSTAVAEWTMPEGGSSPSEWNAPLHATRPQFAQPTRADVAAHRPGAVGLPRHDERVGELADSDSERIDVSVAGPGMAPQDGVAGSEVRPAGMDQRFHAAPPVRAMQIHDAYLVVETADGLTVVDQHALHERILYEQFRARVLAGAVESQRLLIPEPVELTAGEAVVLADHTELLAQLGLDVEPFGGGTVLLTAYPVLLGKLPPAQLLREVCDQIGSAGKTISRRDLLDALLHMMACKAAIKAGQRLTDEEVESLLAQRHLVDDAHHCPHGRPTALVLSRTELDRQFGRLG